MESIQEPEETAISEMLPETKEESVKKVPILLPYGPSVTKENWNQIGKIRSNKFWRLSQNL